MMSEVYLPSDIILNIISRLPSKSIARCSCVSKQWASLLTSASPYFSELFLTESKTRRRLVFAVGRNEYEWALYSFPQPQISSTNSNSSSISVTAEFHMSLPKSSWFVHTSPASPSVSGLIYFSNMPADNRPMLCNPSTRQLFWLPSLVRAKRSYFGYDPINKQLSVLGICFPLTSSSNRDFPSSFHILKLESGKVVSWRSLECHLHHYPELINICINGILYYIASFGDMYGRKIACFDLNSEEFKFIDVPWPCGAIILVNLKGKLVGINTMGVEFSEERCYLELSLWVLEDVEKQQWSKHVHFLSLWDTNFTNVSICGVSTAGELVLSLWSTRNTVYGYFFNLEKNILHKVEINGIEAFQRHSFCGWVDYVEDLKDLNWN